MLSLLAPAAEGYALVLVLGLLTAIAGVALVLAVSPGYRVAPESIAALSTFFSPINHRSADDRYCPSHDYQADFPPTSDAPQAQPSDSAACTCQEPLGYDLRSLLNLLRDA